MGVQDYFEENKEIYIKILEFVENIDCSDNGPEFNELANLITNYKISKDRSKLTVFLRCISSISLNHHRCINFRNKIKKILLLIENEIKQTFSNFEIFDIFKDDMSILHFLFEKGIIIPDEVISNAILNKKENNFSKFFYQEIEKFISEEKKLSIKGEIIKEDQNIFNDFDKKRLKGENDSGICSLIRNDLNNDFISSINRQKISPSSKIKPSIFETNYFLIDKEPTLIEYAAYFGSLRIFNDLLSMVEEFNSNLWLFAVYGQNIEIIKLLEEKKIEKPDGSIDKIVEESIKSHHKKITDHFIGNGEQKKNFVRFFIQYFNFDINYEDIEIDKFTLNDMCSFDILSLYKVLLKLEEIKCEANIFSLKFFNEISIKFNGKGQKIDI